jgi:hypothetical protein
MGNGAALRRQCSRPSSTLHSDVLEYVCTENEKDRATSENNRSNCPPRSREFVASMKQSVPKSVDEYIAVQPEAVRPKLEQVRAAIGRAVPEAVEDIGCIACPDTSGT